MRQLFPGRQCGHPHPGKGSPSKMMCSDNSEQIPLESLEAGSKKNSTMKATA